MATYKDLGKDQLIYLVQYLLTKLKNSSLADNTTYTLEKTGSSIVLKDNTGATVSTLTDALKTPGVASQTVNGLMSASDKKKLDGIASGAEVNKIASIKVNGTAVTITSKTVDITVPTTDNIKAQIEEYGYQTANDVGGIVEAYGYQTASQVNTAITGKGYQTASQVNSAITGKGYQTASQVNTAISTAISNAGHLKREAVDALPAVANAKENVIYMVKTSTTTGNNKREEFMLLNGAFEKIGDTAPDLSGYVKSSDITTMSNEDIQSAVDTAYSAVFTA